MNVSKNQNENQPANNKHRTRDSFNRLHSHQLPGLNPKPLTPLPLTKVLSKPPDRPNKHSCGARFRVRAEVWVSHKAGFRSSVSKTFIGHKSFGSSVVALRFRIQTDYATWLNGSLRTRDHGLNRFVEIREGSVVQNARPDCLQLSSLHTLRPRL